jgi:6-phospho-3-hexuloisomerase
MNEVQVILQEIQSVLAYVDETGIETFCERLQAGTRIFVVGEGRSGLMGKSFAMRLMHLGAEVYAVGETITPAMKKGDLLVAISGSGTTAGVLWVAQKARDLGCTVLAVTTNRESRLAELASDLLLVPAATKFRREGEGESVQPLGSLFDQCAHLLLDAICLRYAQMQAVDNQGAFLRHSNLE